ncbi:MAG: hypothetical protein FJW38_19970 [Acidobacteria bacterium]|nr:hypothetical protein [Acidobacteriota bacterium]
MRRAASGLLGCWAAAVILAAPAADSPPGFATERQRGAALLRGRELVAALPHLERARAADGANYDNNWDLALTYRLLNRLVDARRLLESMPRDRGEVRNLLAEVLALSGEARLAAAEYEEAAHLAPTEKHLADWGNHLMKLGASEAALQVFASGAALHPRAIALRLGLGVAQYALGNYDDAARELCAAAALDPSDLRPLEFLGQAIDTAPARNAEVSAHLSNYAARYPRNARARLYHGLALTDPAARERELRAAVALDPSLARGWLQLGVLAEQRGETNLAIDRLVRAAAAQPDLKPAHYRLSRLYRKTGQVALADKHLARYGELRRKISEPATHARP